MNHGAIKAAQLHVTFNIPCSIHSSQQAHDLVRGNQNTFICVLVPYSLFSALKGKNEMKWLHLHPLPLPSQLDVAPSGLWRICIEEETTWESGV